MHADSTQELGCPTSAALSAIYERRTVRSYTPDVVGEAQLRVLLEAAVHAPTAMHQEPWQFVIVQDRALLARISDKAKVLVRADAAALVIARFPEATRQIVAQQR